MGFGCLFVGCFFLVSFTLLVSLTLNKLTGDGWMDVDGIDSTIQKNKSAVYWTRPHYIIIISIIPIVSYLLKLNQIIITIWLYSWYFVIDFLLSSNPIPLYYTFIYILYSNFLWFFVVFFHLFHIFHIISFIKFPWRVLIIWYLRLYFLLDSVLNWIAINS